MRLINVLTYLLTYGGVVWHGNAAPQYLSDQLQYVADLPTRRRGRLRSSTFNFLDVRPSRRVTVGDRSFTTAGLLTSGLPRHSQYTPCPEKKGAT